MIKNTHLLKHNIFKFIVISMKYMKKITKNVFFLIHTGKQIGHPRWSSDRVAVYHALGRGFDSYN